MWCNLDLWQIIAVGWMDGWVDEWWMGDYDVLKLRGVSEHSWMEKSQVLSTGKNVGCIGESG